MTLKNAQRYASKVGASMLKKALYEGWGRRKLSNKSPITSHQARVVLKAIEEGELDLDEVPDQEDVLRSKEWKTDGDTATCKVIVPKGAIKTEEDLYREAEIDPKKWRVKSLTVKAWNQGQKNADGDPTVVQLHSVSARLEKRHEAIAARKWVDELLEEVSEGISLPDVEHAADHGDPHCLLLSLPDLHFGKWAVTDDWDIPAALAYHDEAVAQLIEKASGYEIEEIVYIVGHDMTQIDSKSGTTTSGTHVEYWDSWRDQHRAAERASRQAIDRAREVAPVQVYVVPGNHDENTAFSIGQVIGAVYEEDEAVTVTNHDNLHKFHRYGTTLLGFAHGKGIKKKDMAMLMPNARPEDWAQTSWREWHTGHIHSRKRSTPGDYVEAQGVVIRVSPALCPADQWHVDNGWMAALRGAEAYIYSRERGFAAQLSYNVLEGQGEMNAAE